MKKSSKVNQTKELTIISANTELEGSIETAGRVLVIGSFSGTIKAYALEVIKDGSVKATVEVEDAMLGGEFEGEMVCNGHLGIASTATVKGRILSRSLSVESGVLLNCSFSTLESEETKLLPFQQRRNHP